MRSAVRLPPPIEAAAPLRLHDPLDFFFAEHFRQRQVLGCLDRFAGCAVLEQDLAVAVLAFLRRDLPLHVQDEEQDLFPLLRRRCRAEDDIDAFISRLTAEHTDHRRQAGRLIKGLEKALAEGRPPAAYRGLRKILTEFAQGERRHLALENAVVLPLARRRLRDKELTELSVALSARRGKAQALEKSASEAPRTT